MRRLGYWKTEPNVGINVIAVILPLRYGTAAAPATDFVHCYTPKTKTNQKLRKAVYWIRN